MNAVTAPEWLTSDAPDVSAVRAFCAAHDNLGDLQAALDLVTPLLAPGKMPAVSVGQGAETEAEWLLIEVAVPGPPPEAFTRNRRYVEEWVRSVPAGRRGKVRLAYHVA
jgi:hypothetical protein